MSRRANKLRRRRNRPGQIGTVLAIGICLGLGVFGVEDYVAFKQEAARKAADIAAASEDEIYTGSILHVPDRGTLCRQLLFDNQNGQFTDNGYVDCAAAMYRNESEEPKHWPSARVRVISTGFRQRS